MIWTMLTVAEWALALLGAAWRGWGALASIRTVRALQELPPARELEIDTGAHVSMIVAARDEIDTFSHEAETIARLAHPDLQIVLVDDRSSDGTGELMDQIAAAHPSVTVVHITELPAGWLGKVHALEQGRRAATGTWLLFTDADVELAADVPRRAAAFAHARGVQQLALLPTIRSDGLLIASVTATFARWLLLSTLLWRAADPARPESFGIGACNLVRADSLDRAGGFVKLRMDIADDAALAQLIAASGAPTMLVSGIDDVAVRWQTSVRAMARGFEKYGGTGGIGSIPLAIGAASAACLLDIAPWIALAVSVATGALTPLLVSIGTLVASTLLMLRLGTRIGMPRRALVAGPVAPLIVCWMQLRAAWLEHRRGGVIWRDTFYSSAELRAARSYRLPTLRDRTSRR